MGWLSEASLKAMKTKPAKQSKTIVQFWHHDALPLEIDKRIQCWKEFNPGWKHELFHRATAAEYLARVYGSSVSEAFLDIRLPAMMADVFRVARLFAGSGVYVDAATICNAPLSTWLPRKSKLLLLAKQHMDPRYNCANGFIYARKPRHPFMGSLWRRIRLLILARKGTCTWSHFGPELYWEMLANERLRASVDILPLGELKNKIQFSSSSKILPSEQHWSKQQGKSESLYFEHRSRSLPAQLRKLHARFTLLVQGVRVP